MEEQPPATALWAAVGSLALGALSLAWLGLLGALPAVALGVWSLRALNASGRPRGAWMAYVGLATGGASLVVTALGSIAILAVTWRVTAQKAECLNNLRVVGIALNEYADLRETFPPAVLGPDGMPSDRQVAWTGGVVPLLARAYSEVDPRRGARVTQGYAELAAAIDLRHPWDDEANAAARESAVRFFLCPAHPEFSPRSTGTHYVGVAGSGDDAASLKRDDPRAGVFGYSRGVKREEVDAGMSFTLVVIETGHENGPWMAGGSPTVRGIGPGEELLGPGRPFGGLHPGIAQALWLDGSARPVSEKARGEQLRQAACIHRGGP
jgi:hypothetical protein